MKIKVLGCHGSESPGFKPTCFLINETIAIDAGALTSSLTIPELKKIKHIFITHAHLDHIKDLAFLSDNLFKQIDAPVEVFSTPKILAAIRKHFFNDIIWPDFTKLPSEKKPTIQLVSVTEPVYCGDIEIEAIEVDHTVASVGYLIHGRSGSVAISGDTGPTKRFWERLKECKNLKAILVELSFPSTQQKIADDSKHYTPPSLKRDLAKIKADIPIFLYHLKPGYISEITKELKRIGETWTPLSIGQVIDI